MPALAVVGPFQPARSDSTHSIKDKSSKGVTIAIMGCIVNGPVKWLMRISDTSGVHLEKLIYTSEKSVKYNVPADEALGKLIGLIKEQGKWIDA